MHAVVIDAPGAEAVPRLAEHPDPVPGPGEALVRVTAVALGHLDVTVGTGAFGATPPPPYVPGADGAGVVVVAAAGGPAAGERVWIRGGGLGVARDGLAAPLAAVPAAAMHAFPADVDPALAAAFFSPATSALVAVHDLGQVTAGSTVLVSGAAGAVGALTVQLAAAAGARVVGTVGRRDRLPDVPPEADAAIAGDPGPGALEGLPGFDGGRVDLLVDTVGGPGLPARLALVRPGGRAVLVGYTAGQDLALHLPTFLRADVALLPLSMQRRAASVAGRAPDLLARIAAGDLRLPLRRYPLADAAVAWADLRAGRVAGRAVLLAGRATVG